MSTPADQARAELEKLVEGASLECRKAWKHRLDRHQSGLMSLAEMLQESAVDETRAILLSPIVVAAFAAMVEDARRLMQERDDYKADYFRRHEDVCREMNRRIEVDKMERDLIRAAVAAARQSWETERAQMIAQYESLERRHEASLAHEVILTDQIIVSQRKLKETEAERAALLRRVEEAREESREMVDERIAP